MDPYLAKPYRDQINGPVTTVTINGKQYEVERDRDGRAYVSVVVGQFGHRERRYL